MTSNQRGIGFQRLLAYRDKSKLPISMGTRQGRQTCKKSERLAGPCPFGTYEPFLVGSLDRVKIVADSHVIAEHVRDWESENVHYDPVHYLALLERKPNSLDFGKPFEAWNLPEVFTVLRRRLESEGGSDGRREFIKILRLLESGRGELSLSLGGSRLAA